MRPVAIPLLNVVFGILAGKVTIPVVIDSNRHGCPSKPPFERRRQENRCVPPVPDGGRIQVPLDIAGRRTDPSRRQVNPPYE
jgi:hypothetical protein